MKNVRKILCAMLAALVAVSATACSGDGGNGGTASTDSAASGETSSAAAESEPVSIELWFQGAKEDGFLYETAVKALEEYQKVNPNFEVSIMPGGEADVYLQKVLMAAASDDLPEVFSATAFNMTGIPETGVLTDLTEAIDSDSEWSARFTDEAWEKHFQFTDGKKYGVPTQSEIQGWFLNKRLFDEQNLEIPVTYEEWLTCIDKFNEAGIQPIAYGAVDAYSRWGFDIWFWRYGFGDNMDKILSKEMKFADFALPVYQKIDEMAKHTAFPENVSTATCSEAIELFSAGQAAMVTTGSWELENLLKSPEVDNFVFSWGQEFSDSEYDQKVGTKATAWAYWAGKKASESDAKLAAVTEYLKMMSDPVVVTYLTEEKNIITACQYDGDTSELPGLMQSLLEKKDDEYASGGEISGFIDPSFESAYWNSVSAVITQTATPEEAVQQLDDAMAMLS